MKLTSLLAPELIFFDVPGETREEFYKNILRRIAKIKALPASPEQIAADMIERENAANISYDAGFAFPHVRYPMLTDLDIAIAIPAKPFKIRENDKQESKVVICNLISENTSVIYLKILAAFTRFVLSSPAEFNALAATKDPEQFLRKLDASDVKVQSTLCAENVMKRDVLTVKSNDPISKLLDIIAKEKYYEVPVVDDNNRIVGLTSGEQIFRSVFPDYIMRMDNLNFLSCFEPFETLFKEEDKSLVKEVMIPVPEKLIVRKDTPVIQLTMTLLKEKGSTVFVLDEDDRLTGAVDYVDLISNILRG